MRAPPVLALEAEREPLREVDLAEMKLKRSPRTITPSLECLR